MSYSPVEIRHVRFSRTLLGYRRGAVDTALAEIASSYEAVWQERMDLADRVDELEREVARHREVEELMRTTMLTASRRASSRTSMDARSAVSIVVRISSSTSRCRATSRSSSSTRSARSMRSCHTAS